MQLAAYQNAMEMDSNGSHTYSDSSVKKGLADPSLARGMKSANFFQMSGIPKFGKNWLDNFIPDEEMQNTFMTSEVVRNVVMLQCVYYAHVFNSLWIYKHTFVNRYNEDAEAQAAARLAQGG